MCARELVSGDPCPLVIPMEETDWMTKAQIYSDDVGGSSPNVFWVKQPQDHSTSGTIGRVMKTAQ